MALPSSTSICLRDPCFQLGEYSIWGGVYVEQKQKNFFSEIFSFLRLNQGAIREVMAGRPNSVAKRFHAKHYPVMELCDEKFKGTIIKIMADVKAQQYLSTFERFHGGLDQHSESSVLFIPSLCHVQARENDDCMSGMSSFVLMNKAPGDTREDSFVRQDVESIYEEFEKNPPLKERWRAAFIELAKWIAKEGYWDVSWNNFILDLDRDSSPKSIAVVDLEDIELGKKNVCRGIVRLVQMAHPDFCQDIFENACKSYKQACDGVGIADELTAQDLLSLCKEDLGAKYSSLEAWKAEMKERLAFNSLHRQWLEETGGLPEDCESKGTPTALEKKIIGRVNEYKTMMLSCLGTSLPLSLRRHSCHPFLDHLPIGFRNGPVDFGRCSLGELRQALENLKEMQCIQSYKLSGDEPFEGECRPRAVVCEIYF